MAKVVITLTDDTLNDQPTVNIAVESDPPLDIDIEDEDVTEAQRAAVVCLEALHDLFGGIENMATVSASDGAEMPVPGAFRAAQKEEG